MDGRQRDAVPGLGPPSHAFIVAIQFIIQAAAGFLNQYPDRFLFGTDEVAPKDTQQYLRVYRMYDPMWKLLTPQAREKVTKLNYERLFDAARARVRAWEKANVKAPRRE